MAQWFRVLLLVGMVQLVGFPPVVADEGMWLLPLIKKYNEVTMRAMGLEIPVESIYSPGGQGLSDAIVQFGNGCTGELVSSRGLLMTNHHCGYASIQQHSSVEHDYLRDGFWAQSFEEEIPTPGLTVTFLREMREVTSEITAGLTPDMDEEARAAHIRQAKEKFLEQLTREPLTDYRVTSFYGGNQFYLLGYQTFPDVRLVGAPPSSIGKFGADTDNWVFPRHTGDFSIFRVYANSRNEPAEYSPDNQPYHSPRWLRISIEGYQEGEFAMILGYPGSTSRYMTSWELDQTLRVVNTDRARIRGLKQEVWMRHMDADPAVRIKYASKYAASANYWKNAIGQNEALRRLRVVTQKQVAERDFNDWCMAQGAAGDRYLTAMREISEAVTALDAPYHLLMYYSEALMRGMEFTGLVRPYLRLDSALSKDAAPELLERLVAFSGKQSEAMYKDYDPATDRETSKAMLRLFRDEFPQAKDLPFFARIDKDFGGDIDRFVDALFETSVFVDRARLLDFMKRPRRKHLEKDLGFEVASQIFQARRALQGEMQVAISKLSRAQRVLIEGRLAMLGDAPSYPDANSTMRLTYGSIQGYSPRDAVRYEHRSTLAGVLEKEDPESWEFSVPDRLKTLYEARDFGRYADSTGLMPLNFLTTNDITGGNSGSPVLNGRGELIGLAFDGNWESLSGDIDFEENLQRCINVDIRYVLFIIEKYAGCTRLIDEMTVVSGPPRMEGGVWTKARARWAQEGR